jgi:hypothetical protein
MLKTWYPGIRRTPRQEFEKRKRPTGDDPSMEQSVDGPSKIVHEALLRVSCTGCRKLHRVEHLLDFSPICPACAAK